MDEVEHPYRKIANSLRFVRDKENKEHQVPLLNYDAYLNYQLRNGLLVNSASTPIIENALLETCRKLHFPREWIKAFVFASSDIQASCLTISNQECVIQLSSSLVNMLNQQELSFILGHELGHHVLGHIGHQSDKETLEGSVIRRAQEISVDRIGLYCCGELKSSMNAIIKTISGLNDYHLKFDVGQFVSQLSKASKSGFYEDVRSSHPSFLFRAKALLLFFDQTLFDKISNFDFQNLDLSNLNGRVEKELDNLVEMPFLNLKKKLSSDYKMWISMQLILKDGEISKSEQKLFDKEFGEENLQKFLKLVSTNGKSEVMNIVSRNIDEAFLIIQKNFPKTSDKITSNLIKEAKELF